MRGHIVHQRLSHASERQTVNDQIHNLPAASLPLKRQAVYVMIHSHIQEPQPINPPICRENPKRAKRKCVEGRCAEGQQGRCGGEKALLGREGKSVGGKCLGRGGGGEGEGEGGGGRQAWWGGGVGVGVGRRMHACRQQSGMEVVGTLQGCQPHRPHCHAHVSITN